MRDGRTVGSSSMTSGNILWAWRKGEKVGGGLKGGPIPTEISGAGSDGWANAMWEPEHVCFTCNFGSHNPTIGIDI